MSSGCLMANGVSTRSNWIGWRLISPTDKRDSLSAEGGGKILETLPIIRDRANVYKQLYEWDVTSEQDYLE